ncbi:DUF6090 family protein [Balneola sp. MJW-20]|uniref:DUF6090 family protein n=1 Tax=Gracilimonas aurantiaca TaxID=3234185 RepID=UPI00346597D3
MITLLRRFRQKLIGSGTLTKYLIYAIGEILLVVIGILIALQVNNWNEGRKDRIMERRFLSEMMLDLQSDSLTLAEFKEDSDEQVRTKEQLRKYYQGTPFQVDSLIIFFEDQWKQRYNFNPITTTLDEMKSTGKLSVIRNEELRRNILETYNYYVVFQSRAQSIYSEQQEKSTELYYAEIPGLYSLEGDSAYDIEAVLSQYEVQNRLGGNFVNGMNSRLQMIIAVNSRLIEQIRAELQMD